MAALNSRNRTVNAWRERGYSDGKATRQPRTPLNASEAERKAYLAGYRAAKAAERGKRT